MFDKDVWFTLTSCGVMRASQDGHIDEELDLELRHCTCGSTISVPQAAVAGATLRPDVMSTTPPATIRMSSPPPMSRRSSRRSGTWAEAAPRNADSSV